MFAVCDRVFETHSLKIDLDRLTVGHARRSGNFTIQAEYRLRYKGIVGFPCVSGWKEP
jgi:hypothetical protein